MSICIGKFIIKVKRRRRFRAVCVRYIQKLQTYIKPFVIKWRKRKHLEFADIICETLELIYVRNYLFRMQAKWCHSILIIQSFIRKCLRKIRTYDSVMIMQWNLVEAKLHREKVKNKKSRRISRRATTNLAIKNFTSIPDEIKLFYMKSFIRSKVQDFMIELRNYKSEIRSYELKYARKYTKYEVFIISTEEGEICLDFPDTPQSPSKTILFTTKAIKHLIESAMKNRVSWDIILQNEKRRIDRNGKILRTMTRRKTLI
jgi:hypothetical protein